MRDVLPRAPGIPPGLRAVLAGLFVALGAAALLVWQNAAVMRLQINDDFNEQQLVLARQAAAAIGHRLGDVEAETLSLARLVSAVPLEEEALRAAVEAMLHRCRGLGVASVLLVDPGGGVRVGAGTPLLAGLPRPPPGPPGAVRAVGPRRVLRRPDGPWRVAGRLMAASGGALPGAVVCDVDLTALIRGVDRHIRSGKTGYPWVIDGEGVFLDHPDGQFVGRNAFEARRERAPEIDFSSIDHIMRDRMLGGEEGTGHYVSGWHGGLCGRIDKLIAFAPLRDPGAWKGETWSVAVVAPESEVRAAVHRVFTRHVAAVALLILALGLLGATLVTVQRRTSLELRRQVERTTAELHEVERIYRRVVEQASDLIYLLDTESRVILANAQAVRLFAGLSPVEWDPAERDPPRERFLGRRLDELLPAADAEFVLEKMDQALFCGHGISYEHTVRVWGEKVRLSTRLMPIREDSGGVRYVLGISRDISRKMVMDQRIYNAEKLASIGTLAAGVAHEINNPLAVILGFVDLLKERFPEGSPEHADLATIEEQAEAARRVVENLLGFARVTEGLEETVDIARSVEQVAAIVGNTLMTRKVELRLELPPDLPRARGDGREFQQVVFNLVNNALAAMEDGGGVITIRGRTEGDTVVVEVEDTGCGIPERLRQKIFDPFFTTKPVGEGTGLGLSLCYGIVTRHGGTITCTSRSREDHPEGPTGTTFSIRLPVADAGESEGEEP